MNSFNATDSKLMVHSFNGLLTVLTEGQMIYFSS